MQRHANVVIIGAGIVGCSLAYHLTRMGSRDVAVVEQGPLFETGGSTSHAPGIVFQVNASKTMTEFARYTTELYASLSLNGQPCWYPVGGMEVAWTPERREDLKRKVGFAASWGVEAELISPREAQAKVPLLADKTYGAMFVPGDGVAKAVWAAEAMAKEAGALGASFHGHTRVTGIEVAAGRVRAVQTDRGRIQAETVVACAGIWAPLVGRMAGVPIPLQPMEHLLATTAPLPELAGETAEVAHPVIRHQDRAMYFRQQADAYMIGSYQHEPLLVEAADIRSHRDAPVMPGIRPFTPSHFESALRSAAELMPALRGIELTRKINGMFSFTPDAMPLLGESPEVRGFWSAQAVWITHAGGVGRAMAEWLVEGSPSQDLREMALSRFHSHAITPGYVRARAAQQYREVYDIIHPLQQTTHPRGLRVSPFHRRQEELGATFFESAGWERPQWFARNERLLPPEGPDWPVRTGWEARFWSPVIGAEHRATRERVAMFDMTPFTKLEVAGPGALAYLQSITANQVDRPVGRATYTSMLTERGGIKCDLTVTRLAEARFLVVTGGATGVQDLAWMREHLPADGSATITDLSAGLCCIGVWGPRARELLQGVSPDDVSNKAFPYVSARHLTVGDATVLAIRISYVGELGWELYAPTEYGLHVWDTLWDAGQAFGVVAAGGGAFDSLRLEKGYRLWGNDIHTEYSPYEAGLGFAVRLNKGEFLGRPALLQLKGRGLVRKLCCLTLDDPRRVVMGKEPVFAGGRSAGYVTSANYGYTVNRSIAYAYLPVGLAEPGSRLEVEYFGARYPATVVAEPLFDPDMVRLRS